MAQIKYMGITGARNVRTAIWGKFHGCCVYCCNPVGWYDFEVEHEIPLSQGGKNLYSNLFPSCKKCNRKKWDMTPSQAGMKNHWREMFQPDGKSWPTRTEA